MPKPEDSKLKSKVEDEDVVAAEDRGGEEADVRVEDEGSKKDTPKKDGEDGAPKKGGAEVEEDRDDEEAPTKELEGKTDEEREQIRKRRREERQARKEYQKQREREIEFLRRQNSELANRIGAIENRNFGSDLARIDSAIVDSESQIEQAKSLIAKASAESNGEALAQAQDALYVARRRNEDLTSLKTNISSAQRRPAPMDPQVANHGRNWMTKNTWFDPRGRDPDSRVALAIDHTLVEEGWSPSDPGYWEELSSRITRYMPHRRGAAGGAEQNQSQSAQTAQRQTTTGSDREGASSSRSAYVLSGERVKAMKEAGMWEQFQTDNVFKARMLRRFKDQDQQGK